MRPGEITSDETSQILPGCIFTGGHRWTDLQPAKRAADLIAFPPYSFRFQATQRRTTLSTSLWVRQPITIGFSLAYVGGIAFGRTTTEVEVSCVPVRPTILPIPLSVSEAITYDIGPMVGVEGRIRMGRQVDLVPGIRLQRASGWMADSPGDRLGVDL